MGVNQFVLRAGAALVAFLVLSENLQAGCVSCGSSGASGGAGQAVPALTLSMGATTYGQSAGTLRFSTSVPDARVFTPVLLTFDGSAQSGVRVCKAQMVFTNRQVSVDTFIVNVTNVICQTNYRTATSNDASGNTLTYTNGFIIFTNIQNLASFVVQTNISNFPVDYTVLRQVVAPQAVADIPPSVNPRGYAIHFYYPDQVAGQNCEGISLFAGAPYLTWGITNTDPTGLSQIQITQTASNNLLKQVSYIYNDADNAWLKLSRANIQSSETTSNLDANTYQVVDTMQYRGQAAAQKTVTTYNVYSGGTVPVQMDVGIGPDMQTTRYTYYPDGSSFNAGAAPLPKTVINPDGSKESYVNYNSLGQPTDVLSTYGDVDTGRETITDYTVNALGGSGDDGSVNPTVARVVIEKIAGAELSRRYTVFPSAFIKLEIQCLDPGATWNDSRNLVTTNVYFTDGPNQFELHYEYHPDGTLTTYDYATNDLYRTTTIASGLPDPRGVVVVDGTCTQTVVSQSGNTVSVSAWDIRSGILVSQEIYGNYDRFGRAQTVTHLDETTEQMYYACCGLDYTIDRDGVETVYNYDLDRRQTGFFKYFTGNQLIQYLNVLDPLGRSVQSRRVGTDDSVAAVSGSAYDTAGRVIAQTNASGGVTLFHYSETGSRNRTVINPDGGTRIETYYADGTPKSVTGTAVHPVRFEYGVDTDVQGNRCIFTREIKLLADGVTDSGEWTKSYFDGLGRNTEVLYPDGSYSQTLYNAQGQLWKQVDPDGVTTLYVYNAKGEQSYIITALSDGTRKINSYAILQSQLSAILGGNDRVTLTTNDVISDHGTTVRRSRSYVWVQNGVNTASLVSVSETSVDGLNSWQTSFADANIALTNHSQTSYSGSNRSSISVAPDGSYTVSRHAYGRLISAYRFDAKGKQLSGTTYSYDGHGRQSQVTDVRNGTTTYAYNAADQIISHTTPNPGNGQPETTDTIYDSMERPTTVIQPDGTTVSSVYLLTGELGLQYGSRTYPVAYGFDYAGRQLAMTNWSGFDSLTGARVTAWNYDSQRGWLTGKVYPDGRGPSYRYTAGGRLQQRTWARNVATTYAYDLAGELNNVSYSDTTPGVTYTYDRLGRQNTVAWNGMTDTLTCNLASQILGDTFSGGALEGLGITNSYDNQLRRTHTKLNLQNSTLFSTSYSYDAASRLQSISDGNGNEASYSYLANSPMVSQITYLDNGTARMTTRKTYDYLNRLTQVSSQPSASGLMPIAYNYSYNLANQRTRNSLADGSYWVYGYDWLGQATNACKYFADGTRVPGQQFHYRFDTIGNRIQTGNGGDASGENLRTAHYTANDLNQVIQRDVPGTNDILGAALAANPVTVNGRTASRKGEYFWSDAGINNTATPAWLGVTNISANAINQGNLFIAKTPEIFFYDADGNLTNDGRWAYVWDAENRLIQMTANTDIGPQYRLTFAYDYKSRRIGKTVATNDGTAYIGQYTNTFVYDGWNLIAILNSSFSILNSFTWGSDLSGSPQGAGGVGGLLCSARYVNSQLQSAHFYAFDGNGNVAGLINAADGNMVANYEYGAFGEPIRMTGAMARANPFRFSTKYADDETDLLYYGYRYYKPSTGTWLNRDPMDTGNLYCFVDNNTIIAYDFLGLWGSDVHMDKTRQWANQLGIDSTQSQNIGAADNGIDKKYDPSTISDATWSWHFNRSISGDSRLDHSDDELGKAKAYCTKQIDDPFTAATYLGYSLHPLQDWVAHGDFNRRQETPSLTTWGPTRLFFWHNYFGPDGTGAPDNVGLDSNGLDGRASINDMHLGWTFSDGDKVYWANFHVGSQRINKTESLTKGLLGDFQSYVRSNGKPCGKCWKAFLGDK